MPTTSEELFCGQTNHIARLDWLSVTCSLEIIWCLGLQMWTSNPRSTCSSFPCHKHLACGKNSSLGIRLNGCHCSCSWRIFTDCTYRTQSCRSNTQPCSTSGKFWIWVMRQQRSLRETWKTQHMLFQYREASALSALYLNQSGRCGTIALCQVQLLLWIISYPLFILSFWVWYYSIQCDIPPQWTLIMKLYTGIHERGWHTVFSESMLLLLNNK